MLKARSAATVHACSSHAVLVTWIADSVLVAHSEPADEDMRAFLAGTNDKSAQSPFV